MEVTFNQVLDAPNLKAYSEMKENYNCDLLKSDREECGDHFIEISLEDAERWGLDIGPTGVKEMLKEAQQDGDNLRHEAWLSAKIRDTRVSLWVLSCASLAVYLDVIKIDSNGNFLLEWLMRVIS